MKIFVLLLVGLGVALYFPNSRAWVLENAAPVVNPILRTATQSEMDKIVTAMQQHARENFGRYPDTKSFQAWLEGKYSGGGSRDSWGNTYELEDMRREQKMRIRSWGPDGLRDTGDDMFTEFRREGR